MNKHGLSAAITLILASSGPAIPAYSAPPGADTLQVSCPLSLPAATFKPDRVPEGWSGALPLDTRVSGAGLLHGPPKEMGVLKPGFAKSTGSAGRKVNVTRWKLDVPHPYETWVFCEYGPLQLAKRIPPNAVECTSTSKGSSAWFEEIVFTCK
jgi:hypothetical protein